MSTSVKIRCNCGTLRARDSRCPTCTKQADQRREGSHERGYGRRWRNAALRYLDQHPLCVECQRQGKVTAAQCVDHIIPHRGEYGLFWDERNWQALCNSCHGVKTGRGE